MSTIHKTYKMRFRRFALLAAGLLLMSLLPSAALRENETAGSWGDGCFQAQHRKPVRPAPTDPPPEPEGPVSRYLQQPNGRQALLERYEAWAAEHPEAEPAQVVLQVNMDLDRPFYTRIQTVSEPDSLAVLVTKYNILPDGYAPELEVLGAGYGGGSMRPEAAQAFRAMADAAGAEGVSLRSVSAYRSYQLQKSAYNGYLRNASQAYVDTFSARPGHSEHQTGLAVDINVATRKANFEKTPAFAWLQEHCAEYGFILRYLEDKQDITGYRFEPWHYRYVGEEAARACMDQGLAYEEYIALLPN